MYPNNIKLVRITTVPLSLKVLLPGQMSFMRSKGFDVIMMSADGPEVPDVIEREQCAFYAIPLTRTISPWNDLKCIFLLYKWLRQNKPDIIHSETPKAGLVAMISGFLAGIRVRIHTVAGLPLMVESGFKYHVLTVVERVTNRFATRVWPNSFSLQKIMLEKRLCRAAKMEVLAFGSSNGTDTNRYSPQSIDAARLLHMKVQIQYDENLHYNICVARLVRDKGICELVLAFQSIFENDRKQRLLLIGPYEELLDPLPADVHTIIDNHPGILRVPITDSVEYFLHLCHLFVFPSYREGFPNVIMEAASMGLPVICSRIEGNVDMVEHLQSGLLFEKMNIADLLEKWNYALKNPGKMEQMALALQQKIHTHFDRNIVLKAMYNAYLKLLDEAG